MYILPQVLVHQDLQTVPTAAVQPLRACVIGPNFDIKSYEDNKAEILVGDYDRAVEGCFLWPNRSAGALVDYTWTTVRADNAWLRYWSNPAAIAVPATGDANRLVSSINFKTYKSWARHASFNNRDVQVGDGVRVQATVGPDTFDILTRVTGFQHEVQPAVVSALSAGTSNQATTVAAKAVAYTGDVSNITVSAADVDITAYDGRSTGNVSETYAVTVLTAGAAEVATFSVTSGSGTDNQASVVTPAFGTAVAIGTRGLTVEFSQSGADLFEVGQIWNISVTQAVTPAVGTSGGVYTGAADSTYIVTVLRGGDVTAVLEDDRPLVGVSTTTGIDVGGPYDVTAAPISIGSFGVTVSFLTNSDMIKGDRFYIPVLTTQAGAIKTLVLANTLPAALRGVSATVNLFIRDNVVIPERKEGGVVGLLNYTQSPTQICLDAGITTYHPSWTDLAGLPILIELFSAELYVEYRAMVQAFADSVHTFLSVSELPGSITPDNPFSYALSKALANAGGTGVRGIALRTNDLDGYVRALSKISGRDDVYSIVPLTKDVSIQNVVAAHVQTMSTPEAGRWRLAWLNSSADQAKSIFGVSELATATILDDDQTTGTQYTKVSCTGGTFLASGVQSGDVLRTMFSVDAYGESTYLEFVVDRVVSEDQLFLLTGPVTDLPIATKIEIWRVLDEAATATSYAQKSASFGSRRVRHIWPDFVEADNTVVDGFYLCAALAGLRSAVAPHQGLTNVEVAGFSKVTRSTDFMSPADLDIMAESGTWIVTQSPEGAVYTRHQLSTAASSDDAARAEDSITTNLDSISYYMLAAYAPYIGRANVTPGLLDILEAVRSSGLNQLSRTTNRELGPQVISWVLKELRQHSVLKDRAVAVVTLELPYPFNNFDLYLVV